MSAAVRCLATAVLAWAGLRAASLRMIPGPELLRFGHGSASAATTPRPFVPPLEPAMPFYAMAAVPPVQAAAPNLAARALPVPYYLPIPAPARFAPQRQSPMPTYELYPSVPALQDWPASRLPAAPLPPVAAAAVAAIPPAPVPSKFDRLQLTMWALLRNRQSQPATAASLASGGTLGGSQAGARLTYRFSPAFAASLRTTSAVGTSQSEVAAGLRLSPFPSLPLSVTAERRHALGNYGGRSAFALFAEGGIYGQRIWGFDVGGYAQAGAVGVRERAYFADGALSFTRPVYRQLSAGFGVWGGVQPGVQPGVQRVDAGPRVSYRVRPNVRVHVDWRQRLAGSALPGSGPAITLASDF